MDEGYTAEEATLENLDYADTQQEYQDAMLENIEANYPQQKEERSLFALFWKVIKLKDSTKVANLGKAELGDPKISVRDAQHLSQLGDTFDNPVYGDWFKNHAEITNATSMAKEGFLDELFVSTKKSTVKARKTSSTITPQKWKIFGKSKPENQ